MAQVALAWLVDRPMVTSVILGARTVERLQDNLGAADMHLGDEVARLDPASDPATADYTRLSARPAPRGRGVLVRDLAERYDEVGRRT
jgi:diketogulonate reductase-like aldo/keto reductase